MDLVDKKSVKNLKQPIIEWLKSQLDSQVEIIEAVPLLGSTSSDLFTLQIREKSRDYQLVLRLLTNHEWLLTEPDLADHEAAALNLAKQSGLSVPEVIAWDAHGGSCGIPAVLMTAVPGKVNLQPLDFDSWLKQMAEVLNPLHALDAADFGWQYYSYNKVTTLTPPAWTKHPDMWQHAIEIVNQPPPATKNCYIHRDYHPMNTLWQGESLSGVVDWVNACRGPGPFDLAWNRLNLMSMYGVKAADRLRDHAIAICGRDAWHPYWDLMALIEMLPGPPEVYTPWPLFGLNALSIPLIIQRTEEYLESIIAQDFN
ncbi:MAG: aminoglycoside phosphotransferase family protein [Chloroflexi bacterium HGW-Chloroflexi-4]|nr:MAG: aminoglycoside phosphotransferase family protein [Chloroflexi bacterium HGW-Chloroflexi-4]